MEKRRCQNLQLFQFVFSGSISRPRGMKLYSLKPLSAAEGEAGLTPRGTTGWESSRAEHFFCPADPLPLLLTFSVDKIKQSKQAHSEAISLVHRAGKEQQWGPAEEESCWKPHLGPYSALRPNTTEQPDVHRCSPPSRLRQGKAPKRERRANQLKPVSGSSQFSELFDPINVFTDKKPHSFLLKSGSRKGARKAAWPFAHVKSRDSRHRTAQDESENTTCWKQDSFLL